MLRQTIHLLLLAALGFTFVPSPLSARHAAPLTDLPASAPRLEVEDGYFLARVAGQAYCLIGINEDSRFELNRLAVHPGDYSLGLANSQGLPGDEGDILHRPPDSVRFTTVIWGIRVNFSGCAEDDGGDSSLPILAVTTIEHNVLMVDRSRSFPRHPNLSPFGPLPGMVSEMATVPDSGPDPVLCISTPSEDDLLTLGTKQHMLLPDYAPDSLVSIQDMLPSGVTLDTDIQVQQIVVEPLRMLVDAMLAEGLQPQILSGYRSFNTQAYTYNTWARRQPERAPFISARPGHSEHQLGTTIDFGSPNLVDLTGSPALRYHTDFHRTPEGAWLLENAHRYGFVLSYPPGKVSVTGYYFEPWHYRYVGVEIATALHESDTTLTEYLQAAAPGSC